MFDRIRRSRYVFTVYYGGKVGNQDVEGEGQWGVASLLPLARRQMDRDRHLGRVSTRDQSLIVSNVTYVYYKIVYEKSNAVSSFPFFLLIIDTLHLWATFLDFENRPRNNDILF